MSQSEGFSPAQLSPLSGKPLIVVCGATGLLGGAIVDALEDCKKFRIRGVCKTQDTAASRELQCEGCEMIETDLGHLALEKHEELTPIFEGAQGAFIVTDSLDATMHLHELEIGMKLIEAARKAGVKNLVFSTLPNIQAISHGRFNVPSFSSKAMVEEALLKMQTDETGKPFETVTIVRPGFYFQNFRRFFLPKKEDDKLIFTLPKTSHPISCFNAQDIGPIVVKIFENPQEFDMETIDIAREELTPQEFIDTFRKVCHCNVDLVELPVKEYPLEVHQEWSNEMAELFAFIDEYGFFGSKKDFFRVKSLNPRMQSFENFLGKSEWAAE